MTEYANPSNNFRPLSEPMSRCFQYAGHSAGFVVESEVIVSDVDSVGLDTGPLDGFAKTGESGLDVRIGTGEGVIEGTVVGKDTPTMVTLPANQNSTAVLAYAPAVESDVIIDTDDNVTATSGDIPRIDLYEFTTDSDSITAQTDLREVGERIDVKNTRYESVDGVGTVAVDNAKQLDGVDATNYARIDQNEVITGSWTFNNDVSVGADLQVSQSGNFKVVRIVQGNNGIQIAVNESDARAYFAPIQDGTPQFQSELTFDTDNGFWEFETELQLPTGRAVGAESEYRIEKNGSDANGVINFKTQ